MTNRQLPIAMVSNSESHTDTVGRRTRPESSKVTAQHTLERVRNNQRRHRARRRDYIATLEQKLSEAEQTVSDLRKQIDVLQAELAQCRNQDGKTVSGCPVFPRQLPQQLQSGDNGKSPALTSLSNRRERETDFQEFGLLWDAADLEIPTPPAPLPIQLPLSEDLSSGLGLELVDIMSPYPGAGNASQSTESEISGTVVPLVQPAKCACETALAMTPGSTGNSEGWRSSSFSISDLTLQTTDFQSIRATGDLLSATATPDPASMTVGTCCSGESFSKPNNGKTDEYAMVLRREDQALPEEYGFHSGMESYFIYETANELTMLCAEAYILIAQQNFRKLSQSDVAAWLWHGCRRSRLPGEGCRVKTDLLFSLLSFISDV